MKGIKVSTLGYLLNHYKWRNETSKTRLFATKTYNLKGTSRTNLPSVQVHSSTGHQFLTDLPKYMGGEDTASQPVELLLGSLIGCTQATAMFVGRNMIPRLFIEKMEFDIQGSRDDGGALDMLPITKDSDYPTIESRLNTVVGVIRIHAVDKKGDRIHLSESEISLLAQHTEKRCPVANMMIASGCDMNIKWINA